MTNTEKQEAEKQETFVPDPEVPKKYRRFTGSKKSPDAKGKLFPRKCKSCVFFKQAMPGTNAEDKEGHGLPCNKAYWADPEQGAVPEDFRCEQFVHFEHRKVLTLLDGLKLTELRAYTSLAKALNDMLAISKAEDFTAALERLLTMPSHQRDVVVEWAGEFLDSKSEKARYDGKLVTKGSEWTLKDDKSGTEWTGTVWSSTEKLVKLLVDKEYRKLFGGSSYFTVPPDRFAEIAKPIEDEEDEEMLEDDEE